VSELKLPVYTETVNASICGPCGGACCRQGPGTTAPQDFGSSPQEMLESMILRLSSGMWIAERYFSPFVIDDGESVTHVIADVSEILAIRPGTKRTGACVFWQSGKGCTIFDTRPTGCRTLVPVASHVLDHACRQPHADGVALTRSWIEHQPEVLAAVLATGVTPQDSSW